MRSHSAAVPAAQFLDCLLQMLSLILKLLEIRNSFSASSLTAGGSYAVILEGQGE